MFFEDLSKHLADGQMLNITVMQKEGVMTVMSTTAIEKKPLSITGVPVEIDSAIIEVLTKYLSKKEVTLTISDPSEESEEEEKEVADKPAKATTKKKATIKEIAKESPNLVIATMPKQEAVPEVIKAKEVPILKVDLNKDFTEMDLTIMLKDRDYQLFNATRNGSPVRMYVCERHHFVGPIMNKFICMVNPTGKIMTYSSVQVGELVPGGVKEVVATAEVVNMEVKSIEPIVVQQETPWEEQQEIGTDDGFEAIEDW